MLVPLKIVGRENEINVWEKVRGEIYKSEEKRGKLQEMRRKSNMMNSRHPNVVTALLWCIFKHTRFVFETLLLYINKRLSLF